MDLRRIIDEGESQQVEFKSTFIVEAMESIVAFANTEGGKVVIGVSNKRKIVGVDIKEKEDNRELATELATNLHQLVTNLSVQVKELIISLKEGEKSASELLLAPELAPELALTYSDKSPSYFKKKVINPAIEQGIIAMLYPDTHKHPKQKYYLTETGRDLLKALQAQNHVQENHKYLRH